MSGYGIGIIIIAIAFVWTIVYAIIADAEFRYGRDEFPISKVLGIIGGSVTTVIILLIMVIKLKNNGYIADFYNYKYDTYAIAQEIGLEPQISYVTDKNDTYACIRMHKYFRKDPVYEYIIVKYKDPEPDDPNYLEKFRR